MTNEATIEIYRDGKWQPAAVISQNNPETGHNGAARLRYIDDYTIANFSDNSAAAGVSCRYPVDFDIHDEATWPAFLLDILPNGAGRQHWLGRLDLVDAGDAVDWPLLLNGTAFPPGNLRIKEAAQKDSSDVMVPSPEGKIVANREHPGFTQEDILERQEYFIEYAFQNGAQTAGASDVQGVAPKFLMAKDHFGKWHAEGALKDHQVASHWLIKFPRGKTEDDRLILRNEAAYMKVARALGVNVFNDLEWQENTLFIPRFDRAVQDDGRVRRYGMESLASLAGIAKYGVEYGGTPTHNTLCEALKTYATEPVKALTEYIVRDVANVLLGNKDNHPRNSAVFRYENGRVELTPLYDFAPMYLDPEGIARACRWENDLEVAGEPDWVKVVEAICNTSHAKARIFKLADKVERLEEIMKEAGVDDIIIERKSRVFDDAVRQLREVKNLKPKTGDLSCDGGR